MSLFEELKRRNVIRIAAAYIVAAWLLIQVAETIFPLFGYGDQPARIVVIVLSILFIPALVLAWAFELTPDGLKRDHEVERSRSITPQTGKRLDRVIMAVLAVALIFFAFDKFALDPQRKIDIAESAAEAGAERAMEEARLGMFNGKSIAVLPFVNMSSDPEQEYFSDGLSEEILNLLAKIPNLKVIGRTSSFAFKGENEDLRVIGAKLGVKTVLEGSVRKSGDQVRITAQLIDVADGSHLWSNTYDRTLSDIFAIQDDVAAAIIGALQIHIGASPTRGRPTDNSEAYSMFLKARVLFEDVNEADQSKNILLSVIALDPEFAEAYELLARVHWNNSEQQPAAEAAAKALAIDPDLVLAKAVYHQANIGSHLAGIEAFEQALREQPDEPLLLQALIWNLNQAGYFSEAVDLAQRWVDVDPLSIWANEVLATALYVVGRTSEADATIEVVSKLTGSEGYWEKGHRSLAAGQDEQAIAYFEATFQHRDDPNAGAMRDFVTHARDPTTGQAYLDSLFPGEIGADWYLYFGFIDRYFELLFARDPNDERWTEADFYLRDGVDSHDMGFTANPKFLEVAETMGLIRIWEKRGPPDICDKVNGQWVCK
jgi:adenylate cyclase